MLKREATLLLERIAEAANEIEQAMKPLLSLSPKGAANAYQIVMDRNRSIRFDTARLSTLVDADSRALREVYTGSVEIVDSIRLSGATLPDAETGLVDIQAAIEAVFPHDTLAG